jgi:uncharacterized protein YidB (DUF937 family)
MGIFDELTKNLGGGQGGQAGGGGQAALLQAVMALLAGGGLQKLISSFRQNGMGDVIGSWISTGANKPVTPEQVGQALGPDELGRLSQQSGLDAGAVTSQLSTLLPKLVDSLTPDGNVPEGGAPQDRLTGLLKGLF